MTELFCSKCSSTKDSNEFTVFKNNPDLKDRDYRVTICRDCCSKMMEQLGNTKGGLKEILRFVDVPYLEKYANTAISKYNNKVQNTNVVIKQNVHSKEETVAGVEKVRQQNNVYTCYVSMLGLFPKKYLNFSYSDGVRTEELEEQVRDDTPQAELQKEVEKAHRFINKMFGAKLFADKKRFPKAVELKYEELSLHKNDSSERSKKFRLKNFINSLIEAGELEKADFEFLYKEVDKSTKDTMVVEVDPPTLPDDEDIDGDEIINGKEVDIKELRDKWGKEHSKSDLIDFEKKYWALEANYKIKTASHEEFLKHACIASVKANQCMAQGDVDNAKSWMTIFEKMTNAGRLQPSQFSKSDMSGGVNNFGEWYRMVEESRKVIDVLPEMYATPRDRADVVLFCMVNYVRRLKNLPDATHAEIYKFYEEMESQFIDENDEDVDFENFLVDGD